MEQSPGKHHYERIDYVGFQNDELFFVLGSRSSSTWRSRRRDLDADALCELNGSLAPVCLGTGALELAPFVFLDCFRDAISSSTS